MSTTLRVRRDLEDELDKLAELTHCSQSDLANETLELYFEQKQRTVERSKRDLRKRNGAILCRMRRWEPFSLNTRIPMPDEDPIYAASEADSTATFRYVSHDNPRAASSLIAGIANFMPRHQIGTRSRHRTCGRNRRAP
jgi:hypothetical protein